MKNGRSPPASSFSESAFQRNVCPGRTLPLTGPHGRERDPGGGEALDDRLDVVLSETYRWSTDQIVHRYVMLGCACLAAIAVAWALARFRARQD